MSIGSLGIVGGLAATSLVQKTGAAVDRAMQDTAHAQRLAESTQLAADAAGIGQTHEEHEAGDRDADGRMPWERQEKPAETPDATNEAQPPASDATEPPTGVRDPTGESGGQLDVVG